MKTVLLLMSATFFACSVALVIFAYKAWYSNIPEEITAAQMVMWLYKSAFAFLLFHLVAMIVLFIAKTITGKELMYYTLVPLIAGWLLVQFAGMAIVDFFYA